MDQGLQENGRSRLNAEGIRQALEPVDRGDIEGGREHLQHAEDELRRLARDVADARDDPKAVALRLLRRQDTLNRDIDEAIQSFRGKTTTAEEKLAFAARLKPLESRQRAITELAKSIKPPAGKEGQARFPHEAARDAAAKTSRAADTLPTQKLQEITDRKNEARQALERLAGELHDQWRRQEPTRQQFSDARRQSNEVAEEISRNMRETDPRRTGRPPPRAPRPSSPAG